jgi:tocopherol O-methyltransferase
VILLTNIPELVTYYEDKTEAILRRYGPGPRVHYHTGLLDAPLQPSTSPPVLRERLIAAQERMLYYASKAWQLRTVAFRDVLDVGCGLGGGAIFWAQEFGARVTAVTVAPSHIALVSRFATRAAVASQIRPLLCDALAVPGENCFDSAVAVDSSSSFPRRPWFQRLAGLLRPKGHVFIFDCFLERSEYEEPFNRHWCAQIGRIEEYLATARDAGFTLKLIEDVSLRAAHFWTTTLALMRAEAHERRLSSFEGAKLEESLRTHSLVRQGLFDRGLRHLLLSFVSS